MIVVNTARTDVIDNLALVRRLQSGHIRHAATDVFSLECSTPDDSLLG